MSLRLRLRLRSIQYSPDIDMYGKSIGRVPRVYDLRGFGGAVVLWFGVAALSGAPQSGRKLEIAVRDQSNLAVPGVHVELKAGDSPAGSAETGEDGYALFFDLK